MVSDHGRDHSPPSASPISVFNLLILQVKPVKSGMGTVAEVEAAAPPDFGLDRKTIEFSPYFY
jgi:hypothetical protein